MAFSVCYLASPFGVALVGEVIVDEVMAYVEAHQVALRDLVGGAQDD